MDSLDRRAWRKEARGTIAKGPMLVRLAGVEAGSRESGRPPSRWMLIINDTNILALKAVTGSCQYMRRDTVTT